MVGHIAESVAERVAECVAECIEDRRRVGDGCRMVIDLGRRSEMVAWMNDVCLRLSITSGCIECTSKKCRAHHRPRCVKFCKI